MDSARRGGFSCRSIFSYNLYLLSYGLRTQKTDGTVTTDFYWANGNMTYQYDGTNELYFRYDESGAPVSININGTDYYYVKNLQGDIIALLDGQGSCVVKYTYDAWGKVLSVEDSTETNAGTINPLRYRGYYYDSDLGFYYLQSRYYDPTVGRFLNADEVDYLGANGTVLSYNLFAYCENNPANSSDFSGAGPFLAIGIQFVITWGRLTVGLEVLWSVKNSNCYLFAFVGGARSFNNSAVRNKETELIRTITSFFGGSRGFALSKLSLFSRIGVSVSFVAVLGNRKASFPRDYCGWFTGGSFSFCHLTVSGAYSFSKGIKIGSLGIGVTSSRSNFSFSQTYYFQLTGNNAFKNNIKALKSGINNRVAHLKLFACFF